MKNSTLKKETDQCVYYSRSFAKNKAKNWYNLNYEKLWILNINSIFLIIWQRQSITPIISNFFIHVIIFET